MKKTLDIKKLILLNMPYILLGLFATNFGEAWRMAQGADASEKFLSLVAVLPAVHDFTSFLIVAVVSGNRKSRHFKINSEVTALSIAGIRVPEMKKAHSIYTVCYIKFIFNYSN